MEGYHSQVSFRLLNRNIHELEVWVLEDRLLGEEETKALLSEKRLKQVLDADGILTESWVRWERTESFQYHGPAEKCYILDANEGILTFGGGAHGAIPAPGRPDGIRVKYSIGGGKACNLLPGQISGLELSAGFVSMAVNPLALSGGYDRETAREAMDRAGRELKHKFRAVTADDYIALAREAAGDIEKAACYSGLDFKGLHQPGAVTLVLLKRDYETGGPFFGAMKKQVREYLQDKLPAGMASENSLFIREPILVGIELMVTARVEGFQNMFEVRRKINQALDEFLNPVTGNFDHRGWEIGTLPDRMQLETVIKKVPGLAGLKSLVAFGRLYSEPGRPETDLEEISRSPYVLPVSGSHRIRIETMKDKN